MPIESTFELYQDTAGEWRWRLVVSNGNIIADSGEGYKSKQGAKRGIRSVKNNAPNARVVAID
ncbi:HVO_2922 family protein [Haladaptatus salinisoli]|uniref:HVO_2922 family protein n=1 Tax=Haladaptatus salinisoli TaxID=2884876 RepID=UPI001D0B2D08|nr:HVO_2922 family protein [Haladaptatus salinisoli]